MGVEGMNGAEGDGDMMVEWPNIPPRDESHVRDVCARAEVGNVDLQNEIYSANIVPVFMHTERAFPSIRFRNYLLFQFVIKMFL